MFNKELLPEEEVDKIIIDILARPELTKVIDAFKDGKKGLFGLLTGMVMKECRGKADPNYIVSKLKFHLEDSFCK